MHPAVPLYAPRNLTVIVGAHKTWRHPEFVRASVNQKENKIVREIVYDKTKVRTVSEVIPHKKYLTDMPLYDIGILVLTSPLVFSSTVAPICLPAPVSPSPQVSSASINAEGFSKYTGQVATASGWGWLTSPKGM